MATQRKRPASEKREQSREARLSERAAERGYRLEREGSVWWAVRGGTRWGPLQTLDAVDEFLPV